ncbi:MAG: alpha-amylase family glycosyl hydrolase [Leptospiraceae bacterium]|nr:alpha-amylase family glycosyl hydrolase [Leptospiraceae bacterium]
MENHFFKQNYIYELNTRLFCIQNHILLDEFPETFFNSKEYMAANFIWLMGIWSPSIVSRKIALEHKGLRNEFRKALPDLVDEDIIGSPYSIYEYVHSPRLVSSPDTLRKWKERLNRDGKKLILDFVPNHMSVDSILIDQFPDMFLKKESGEVCHNSFKHSNGNVYYLGRDPYFDGWTDTVQWDFSNPKVLDLHYQILSSMAELCNGVRCDMAMLPCEDIFQLTHGKEGKPYWKPLISKIKEDNPDFIFIGEVYWNREYSLQQLGFDYTYDKVLYDRLAERKEKEIKLHLNADLSFQEHSLRFIENHDEERAMHTFGNNSIFHFSLLSFLPGAILYYQGQELGNELKLPVQLGRTYTENYKKEIVEFYERAFNQIQFRKYLYYQRTTTVFHSYEAISYDPIISYTLLHRYELSAYQTRFFELEILVYNPENREITGWLQLPKEVKSLINEFYYSEFTLRDITTNVDFTKNKTEALEAGIYCKLEPNQAHWFVLV